MPRWTRSAAGPGWSLAPTSKPSCPSTSRCGCASWSSAARRRSGRASSRCAVRRLRESRRSAWRSTKAETHACHEPNTCRSCGRTSLRAAHAAARRRGSPPSPSSRSPWASAPTAPSSASSMAWCSSRCRSGTPTACIASACSIPTARAYSLSAPDFMSVRERNRVFDQVEAYRPASSRCSAPASREEVRGAMVSDGCSTCSGLPVDRPRLPARREPAGARRRRRARSRLLAARVRRRPRRTRPPVDDWRRSLRSSACSRRGPAAGGSRHLRAARIRPDLQRRDGERPALGVSLGVSAGRAPGSRPQIDGDVRRIGAAADDISPHERRSDVHHDAAARDDGRRRAPAAAHAAGRGRLRAARRLRQRRESAARARVGARRRSSPSVRRSAPDAAGWCGNS